MPLHTRGGSRTLGARAAGKGDPGQQHNSKSDDQDRGVEQDCSAGPPSGNSKSLMLSQALDLGTDEIAPSSAGQNRLPSQELKSPLPSNEHGDKQGQEKQRPDGDNRSPNPVPGRHSKCDEYRKHG